MLLLLFVVFVFVELFRTCCGMILPELPLPSGQSVRDEQQLVVGDSDDGAIVVTVVVVVIV